MYLKYFIVFILLVIKLSHRLGDGQRRDGARLEYFWNKFGCGWYLLGCSHGLCLVDNEGTDMLCLN